MRLDDVRVGPRCRREMGDIAGLARSIDEVGLLHPIVVREDGTLIAGARRLAAVRLLGHDAIAATVVALDEIERGEIAENAQRKDFTPSEKVAIGLLIEEKERERARQREVEGGRSKGSGNFPDPDKGETRDIVGRAVGMSGVIYQRAKVVATAAEANPDRFAAVLTEMDRSGRVTPAYQRVRAALGSTPSRAETAPEPARKTTAAVAERHRRIADLARAGHRDDQIAAQLGVSVDNVSKVRRGLGVPSVGNQLSRGIRRDASEMAEGFVAAVEAPEGAIRMIDWGAVDPARVEGWLERLAATVRTINAVRALLRRRVA